MGAELARRRESAIERLTDAAMEYANAEEEDEYQRARDNLRKAAGAYGEKHRAEAIRLGIAQRKKQGRRHGRPPKVDEARARELAVEVGVGNAARLLQVSRYTIWRAVRRGVK